jgi:hypothetical protein
LHTESIGKMAERRKNCCICFKIKFKSIQIFPLAYSTEKYSPTNSDVIPVSVEYYTQGNGPRGNVIRGNGNTGDRTQFSKNSKIFLK